MLHQPTAVWAVAFACVIAFMGIGLVDPILPAIAAELKASPTQTELLFTSYLIITAIAMFFSSWISSRIGAKRTLLIGLALIVLFAAAAGAAGNVEGVIGFRGGWGLGNALFISTALAAIVGAASGGASSAIVLYEAALGLGIAVGPLLGGLLGGISWRGPFFGTAVLMAVAFLSILILLKPGRARPAPSPLAAPFRALGRPGLTVMAVAALFYNFAFFVLLAYTPFALVPLGLASAMTLGLIFCAWGVTLAISSVWVAPLFTRRMRRTRVMWLVLPFFAADMVAAAFVIHSGAALIGCVIAGGLFLGILNTVMTQCSMESTDLPRMVASSAYSGVRFLGGAIAPPLATILARLVDPATPFYVAAGALLVSLGITAVGVKALRRADAAPAS
ncbi:MAG TPA: MFS transporter [Microbacteriaceae bacterium]|nr:MFS transporter [Microbacteriaceae bacterium]